MQFDSVRIWGRNLQFQFHKCGRENDFFCGKCRFSFFIIVKGACGQVLIIKGQKMTKGTPGARALWADERLSEPEWARVSQSKRDREPKKVGESQRERTRVSQSEYQINNFQWSQNSRIDEPQIRILCKLRKMVWIGQSPNYPTPEHQCQYLTQPYLRMPPNKTSHRNPPNFLPDVAENFPGRLLERTFPEDLVQ